MRRNPLRGTRDSAVQNSGKSHDINSSILNSPDVESEPPILARSQPVIPSHLQPELEFQMCQQVERYMTSFRKQIAYGCAGAFELQKLSMPQSIREDTISCHALPSGVRPRLTPRPLLPKPVAPLTSESQLNPSSLPRPTMQIYHMTCAN